jgi:hypothetical protein
MTQTHKPPTARVYALLAREAPVAVVFRRGPSQWVQLVLWDTSRDTFTPGQWFHGRIYARRSDLSPSGQRLIYFARAPRSKAHESDYTYAWTAISRPPYLTALALWPKGDCWGGGGLFAGEDQIRLNHGNDRLDAHPSHRPGRRLTITNEGGGIGEDDPIQRIRLARDGWHHVQEWRGSHQSFRRGWITDAPDVFQRPDPTGRYELRRTWSIGGSHKAETFDVLIPAGPAESLDGADWADWDQQGRLVFARDGVVFAIAPEALGRAEAAELIDLNPNKPEPIETPDWATRW